MSSQKPTTLKALAEYLGVSPASVSLCLNGRAREARISPDTEKRILDAAAEFDFRPNQVARNLRSGKTGQVGVIVPDIANPFFAEFLQAVERPLRDRDYAVLIGDARESARAEEEVIHSMLSRRVDGLILAPVGPINPGIKLLIEQGVPLVLFDRLSDKVKSVPRISAHHREDSRKATRHLIERGHRDILCLRGNPGSQADRERVLGYRDVLQQNEIDFNPDRLIGDSYDREESAIAVNSFFARGADGVTACLSLGGQNTLGLLDTCRNRGIAIPGDLSIVAFDEQPWSAHVDPAMTTLAQPITDMAQAAASELQTAISDGIENAQTSPVSRFTSQLVERDSVRDLLYRK